VSAALVTQTATTTRPFYDPSMSNPDMLPYNSPRRTLIAVTFCDVIVLISTPDSLIVIVGTCIITCKLALVF